MDDQRIRDRSANDPCRFTAVNIDLKTMPFSCRGSYMVLSELTAGWNGLENEEGLYLRTVHSSAMSPLIARLRLLPAAYLTELCQAALSFRYENETLECCFDDPDTLVVRGSRSMALTLDFLTENGPYDYLYQFTRNGRPFVMANCFKNNCRYLISVEQGEAVLDQEWQESTSLYSRLCFSGPDGFLFVLREIETEWDGSWKAFDFEKSRAAMAQSLEEFQARMPSCPEPWASAAEKAGYLLWASIIRKDGFLTREAMLMSKNWMKSVWSWDHCFNAIALSRHAPEMAWDQFMIMFDHQDPTGLLPDSINDVHIVWNYCKPPVHGWALRRIMEHITLSPLQAEEAYNRLSKWTEWWLSCRDYDGDGLCEYNHGNDSGWDNATAFSMLPPVATPELQAFLVIQMDVLAELAQKLRRPADACLWKEKADQLLHRLVSVLFVDDLPVVIRSGSHETVPNDSLLPYVSIVLGPKLPERIRRRMVDVLAGEKFRTSHGFATESPKSRHYRSDGYWRGPIWAPSTMLLLDGLSRCGETALVRKIAAQFANMVTVSGFAENFDAVTGEGLRDRSYTWTASAFLAMTHDYLSD